MPVPDGAARDRRSPDHRRGHRGRAPLHRQGSATLGPRRSGLGRLDQPDPHRGRGTATSSRLRSASPGPSDDWRPRSNWHSSASPKRRFPTSNAMRPPARGRRPGLRGATACDSWSRTTESDSRSGDDSEGTGSDSLGLSGMTERANLIGSRLVIHSEMGVGTTVDVWVPATILDQN